MLEFRILLPRPPRVLDHSCAPPHPASPYIFFCWPLPVERRTSWSFWFPAHLHLPQPGLHSVTQERRAGGRSQASRLPKSPVRSPVNQHPGAPCGRSAAVTGHLCRVSARDSSNPGAPAACSKGQGGRWGCMTQTCFPEVSIATTWVCASERAKSHNPNLFTIVWVFL